MESNKNLFSKPYWIINTLGLLLFVLIGVFLVVNDHLTAFTIMAVCYGFVMFIVNSLYRSNRSQKNRDR
jgi:O-antigen/teichoic acid export membrane protein